MLDRKAWLSVCTLIHPTGVLSGLCAGQSSSSTPNSLLMCLWSCFVHWCSHVGTGRTVPKLFPQSCELELSSICWCAEAFRVHFTGTKRPSPAPEEQPHTMIPLHQTVHLAQCSQTGTVLLQTPDPDCSIRSDGENVSTAAESSGSELYITASHAELLCQFTWPTTSFPVAPTVITPLTADCRIFRREELHDWTCCTGGIISQHHAGVH